LPTDPIAEGFGSRRSFPDLVCGILASCRMPIGKTRIMYENNLSYTQLKRYLKLLASTGMLENIGEGGRDLYRLTAAGEEFVDRYGRLSQYMRRHKGI
jgi:predicted transcriptional regulator